MAPPALRFQQVVKRYGATAVLEGIDLDVARGECFGLVGVNGAGKTSLIKCLFDFVSLDGGSIEIFGASHRLPAARKPLAFLPERFTPPYYLTGADFLHYLLRLQELPYVQADVDLVLAALDLEPAALGSSVSKLSKGTTQKLGLAACLLAAKDALILDEPMSGLDPKARALLKIALAAARARGATVFFSSHALADVEEMCDRMAILHQGALRFIGTPAACRASYGAASLEQAFMRCIG
jgi:ABC-2 type transport system ATP-binding protein